MQKGVDKSPLLVYTFSNDTDSRRREKGDSHEKADVRHVHDVRNDDAFLWETFLYHGLKPAA